ncbi:MAG TPA: TolC family protein [Chthoniobacterales bacterium]|nr:TolC family protein [Chthoniobacterales bacterium]
MRSGFHAIALLCTLPIAGQAARPNYGIDDAVALAKRQNLEIAIARKQIHAARGGLVEAHSGYLPSLVSTGLYDKREHQEDTRLRDEDYNVSLRLQQNVYTGGAVPSQVAIARLNIEKQDYLFQEVVNRVAMDVRVAFYELLLNRAKIRVREDSVRVLEEELKAQQERLKAGTVGGLNVERAQVALANERPELIDAQTQLKNSYLRLAELMGMNVTAGAPSFEAAGQLEYHQRYVDLNECLARADANRPEIKARQKDIEIEDKQYALDQSELRPHIGVFSAYEIYNERDPEVGKEFNHGYLVGISGTWHVFDGFATKGRLQATRARRDAAVEALEAARRRIASEVRSVFFDLEQADRVLEAETKNVQTANDSLQIAKANLAAGLGTQLDILQAASDVTRTQTTRLSAIYLHNAALARLMRACAWPLESVSSDPNSDRGSSADDKILNLAHPPAKLNQR